MNGKIWLVARREFSVRVKKRSFIVMTILMPFLMAALVLMPMFLAMIKDGDRKTVAVVDNTGLYAPALKSNASYLFVPTEKMTAGMRSDSTDIDAVVHITGNLVDNPAGAAIYSREEIPADLTEYVGAVLTEEARKEKFARYDIPGLDAIIADVQQPVAVATIRWTDDGEQQSMADLIAATGMLLTFLTYLFVMSYGGMVLQSVAEEKSNRIVELMVSSVRPYQLMMGKIVGIGLVGLFQMLVWAVMLAVIFMGVGAMSDTGVSADSVAEIFSAVLSLPLVEIVTLFVLYFIGGYLLYASILAACGASVNDAQDSQQFLMPVMVLMLFAFYAGFYGSTNPDGPLAYWCSFIPFTSPIVMMVRVPYGIPVYEEILSIALLYVSALVLLALSAKVYRTGILMYGKKISFKEMLRWLKPHH
ncbi:MAG TPA: ABC transporter permease [Candidatus Limisoma intestinavium]|uniref:ABC transporter permease n=1 Tax=Candidatus Limisoma intestinavium TaxID=2840856 RepID=A0A9D1INT7_9BACT|nr:ABC transporter permease [Candidatus Limisoma intestinavium]